MFKKPCVLLFKTLNKRLLLSFELKAELKAVKQLTAKTKSFLTIKEQLNTFDVLSCDEK